MYYLSQQAKTCQIPSLFRQLENLLTNHEKHDFFNTSARINTRNDKNWRRTFSKEVFKILSNESVSRRRGRPVRDANERSWTAKRPAMVFCDSRICDHIWLCGKWLAMTWSSLVFSGAVLLKIIWHLVNWTLKNYSKKISDIVQIKCNSTRKTFSYKTKLIPKNFFVCWTRKVFLILRPYANLKSDELLQLVSAESETADSLPEKPPSAKLPPKAQSRRVKPT